MAFNPFTYDPYRDTAFKYSAKIAKDFYGSAPISGSVTFGLTDVSTSQVMLSATSKTSYVVPQTVSGSISLSGHGLVSGNAYRPFISKTPNMMVSSPTLGIAQQFVNASGSFGDIHLGGNSLYIGPNDESFLSWDSTSIPGHNGIAIKSGQYPGIGGALLGDSLFLNVNGPEWPTFLYFYTGGSPTGGYLGWDGFTQLLTNKAFTSQGFVTGLQVQSQGDIKINYDGSDANSFLYFYDGGSSTGQSLKWFDSKSRFDLSGPLKTNAIAGNGAGALVANGSAQVSGSLYVSGGTYAAGRSVIGTTTLESPGLTIKANSTTVVGASDIGSGLQNQLALNNYGTGTNGQASMISFGIGATGTAYGALLFRRRSADNTQFEVWNEVSNTGTKHLVMSDAGMVDMRDAQVSGSLSVKGNVRLNSNSLYLNFDGADGDSAIYAYEGSSPTGAYLYWNNTSNTWDTSHGVNVAGTLTATTDLKTGHNLYMNYDGPNADTFIYFYGAGGTPTDYSLKYNAGLLRFEFNRPLVVSGQFNAVDIQAAGNLFANVNGPDANSFVYFYEGSAIGAYFCWDHGNTEFVPSHRIAMRGNALGFGTSISDDMTVQYAKGPQQLVFTSGILAQGRSQISGSLFSKGNLAIDPQSARANSYLNFHGTSAAIRYDNQLTRLTATTNLAVSGSVCMNTLRIQQTPTLASVAQTHYFTVNMNGVMYKVPCVAV